MQPCGGGGAARPPACAAAGAVLGVTPRLACEWGWTPLGGGGALGGQRGVSWTQVEDGHAPLTCPSLTATGQVEQRPAASTFCRPVLWL